VTRQPAMVPSVTVVVLNYNYGRYVGEALTSAVAQEPGDYRLSEVVVIDDGSTDHSRKVYRQFPRVRVVLKVHEGFAATLTRAVTEASADWLAVLDADDAFTSDKLRMLAPHLNDPGTLLVQHAEYVVDAEGRSFAEDTHPGGSTSTLLVRVDAARDLLPVTNELFFHVLSDVGHGIRLPDPLVRYRVHDASMTHGGPRGAYPDFMAGVCFELAARLDDLHVHPPVWAGAAQLRDIAAVYRQRGARFTEEARRQRERAAITLPGGCPG
jgi:glycosyltransferase involved in cell wall biosynthesis